MMAHDPTARSPGRSPARIPTSQPLSSPALRMGWAGLALAAALAVTAAVETGYATAQSRGPQSVAPIAERLTPAVVNISTSSTVKGSGGGALPRVPKGSPFEEFFDDFFKSGKGGQERKVSSLGSGFVIDGKEGLIVTNVHVIEGADEIIANFADGSKLKVDKVIGRDSKTDIALLKVTPKKPLPTVKFGSSEATKVGDWVMAIGNPFGLGGTVTVGIISAKARDINSGPYDDYLQTDAAINKGNSGGPLFNMDGDVVGVNTAIISPTGGSIGIGFAVPADTVVSVIEQLKQHGEVRRGWLGVQLGTVSDEQIAQLGLKENAGARVTGVAKGGPAATAGIESDDVILRFDGQEVTTMRSLPRIVAQTPVGKSVNIELFRKGQRRTLKVVVGRLADDAPAIETGPLGSEKTDERVLLGMRLAPLDDAQRKKFALKDSVKGIVVTDVTAGSPAAQREIKAGDVIVEAQDEAVTTPQQLTERIDRVRKSGRRQILLRVENAKGEIRSVAVPLS
jgi:serine protease Do